MAKVRNTNVSSKSNTAFAAKMSQSPLLGVYLGEVMDTKDLSRTGRIRVFIASLAKDKSKAENYVDCQWSSPFAGITDIAGLGNAVENYEDTQTSYGMWMVPPDTGNTVLVAFGDGNFKQAYVLSCVFPDRFTHMIPGNAAGKSYSDPSVNVPVAEKNRRDVKGTHNDATRPIHADVAKWITKQGLINDPLRGAGKASSRRESPSEVFGILTPGPRDPEDFYKRTGGHSFVMDDNLNSRMIRLRTAQGNQLLLDDTTGVIYMINKRGTAWFEMSTNGDIHVYSNGNINMRAKGDFNVRADQNINLEAGQDVHIKAAGDNIAGEYVGIQALAAIGLPPLGTGGNIRFEAAADLTQYAALNVATTASGGDIDISSGGRTAITASGPAPGIGGVQIKAALGPVNISSTLGTTMDSTAGITMVAPTVMALGGQILLNTPGGIPPFPAVPALAAPQIGTNEFKDNPRDAPEFDEEGSGADGALGGLTDGITDAVADVAGDAVASAVDGALGDVVPSSGRTSPYLPTAGSRTGRQAAIKTIVSSLVTNEPFRAHAQSDPVSESEKTPAPDPNIEKVLPAGAITPDAQKPLDNQTPEGSQVGTGYVDQAGNAITDLTEQVKAGTNTINDTISKATEGVTGIINDAKDQASAAAQDVLNGLPQFEGAQEIFNNFQALGGLQLLQINSLGGLIAGLQAVLPPIRFPTSNALGQKIIGIGKQLKELEARLSQFALDQFGLDMDMLSEEIKNMQNTINEVKSQVSDATQFANQLKEKGISVLADGPGAIFTDANGNQLVDFSKGLGPVGAALGAVGTMQEKFNNVKSSITQPLSGNQTVAMTSFVSSVGEESFLNSRVLDYMNDPKKTHMVPREMQKWILDKPGGKIDPVLQGRRQYEAQIWASPDELDINLNQFTRVGTATYQELADALEAKRAEFVAEKLSG
jgi:uncharacterized protein (DUF2345 family)